MAPTGPRTLTQRCTSLRRCERLLRFVMDLLNSNPGRRQMFGGPITLVGFVVAALVAFTVVAGVNRADLGASAFEILVGFSGALTAALMGVLVAGYRSYRRNTPDRIQIGPNGIVGLFDGHLFGRKAGDTVSLAFSEIVACREWSLGPRGSYSPDRILAGPAGSPAPEAIPGGDGVGAPSRNVKGARELFVTGENLDRIREAWKAWKAFAQSEERPLPS